MNAPANLPVSMLTIATRLSITRQRIATLSCEPLDAAGVAEKIDELEAHKHNLETTFRETFFATTGVRWEIAVRVMS